MLCECPLTAAFIKCFSLTLSSTCWIGKYYRDGLQGRGSSGSALANATIQVPITMASRGPRRRPSNS